MRRLFKIVRRMRDRRLRIAAINVVRRNQEFYDLMQQEDYAHNPNFQTKAKEFDSAIANLARVLRDAE